MEPAKPIDGKAVGKDLKKNLVNESMSTMGSLSDVCITVGSVPKTDAKPLRTYSPFAWVFGWTLAKFKSYFLSPLNNANIKFSSSLIHISFQPHISSALFFY